MIFKAHNNVIIKSMYMFGKVTCIKKRAQNLYKIIEEKPSK